MEDAAGIMALVENEEQKQVITSLLVGDELSPGDWNETGCRKLMQQFMARCSFQEDDLAARIKAAENNHDDNLLKELLKSKRKQLTQIKDKIKITE